MADHPQTVVGLLGPVVRVARRHVDRVAVLVERRAQVLAIDRWGVFLNGTDVVDGITRKVRVAKLDTAPCPVALAFEDLPLILDQILDGFVFATLRADAHNLDAVDVVALIRWVVALARGELVKSLRGQRLLDPVRATGTLLEGTDGAHPELRSLLHDGLPTHGNNHVLTVLVLAVEQIEPQQDAETAGAVHLLAFQRLPDRLPVTSRRMHGHKTPQVPEGRQALEFSRAKAQREILDRDRPWGWIRLLVEQ